MDDDDESTGPHVDTPYVDLLMTVVRQLDMRTDLLEKRTQWLKEHIECFNEGVPKMEKEINRVFKLVGDDLNAYEKRQTGLYWIAALLLVCIVVLTYSVYIG